MDPPFSSIISPIAPPISPVFSATPTFSPEVQVGRKKHQMDQNKKLLIALIAASTALGAIIFFMICFWIYHKKRLQKSDSDSSHSSGPSRESALTWHHRMKIALDAARALEYLHEHCNPPVIHRDLKSSNILLDSNFNAKLSDFGLAVLGGAQNKNNIKLSGTLGYVAPEYLLDGKLTDKSDVYAFGVVLLELLLGKGL